MPLRFSFSNDLYRSQKTKHNEQPIQKTQKQRIKIYISIGVQEKILCRRVKGILLVALVWFPSKHNSDPHYVEYKLKIKNV